MEQAKAGEYWVVLCWDRVLAGPEVGGPPWLFVANHHAEQYAVQLRGQGIPAQARGWTANVTEWQGKTLIRHPAIPAPHIAAPTQPMLSSPPSEATATHDAEANGATHAHSAPVMPPPTPSLE